MFSRITRIGGLIGLSISLCIVLCCTSLSGDSKRRWRVVSQEHVGHPPLFDSIIFFDELNGLGLTALGLGSTTDGGINWTWRLESGHRGLYSMRFVDRQKGWIVGAENKVAEEDPAISSTDFKPFILITEDGGTTWQKINVDQFLGTEGARFSTFFSMCLEPSGAAWIVGNAGIVRATIESNAMRTLEVTLTRAALKDVSCNPVGEVWAAGDDGLIMHSEEKKWTMIPYPDGNVFFNRVKVVGNAVWLVGGIRANGQEGVKGLLLNSKDGSAWENKTPREAGLLIDLEFIENEGWLVGAQGGIYHTNNGGATWRKETSPTENDLFSIFFLNAKRGWIGGDKLTVLGLNTD